jgi:hypothetical protein
MASLRLPAPGWLAALALAARLAYGAYASKQVAVILFVHGGG